MRCHCVGSLGRLDRRYTRGFAEPSQPCRSVLKDFAGRRGRQITARAETVSGKSSGNADKEAEDKQENESSWVAKFFEGSDEDEPQWEREGPSLKEKVIEVLEQEKERTKFWGRLAVLALGAVLLSERLSGKGIVTALNMATGVPIMEIEPALGILVAAILAVGILPAFLNKGKKEEEEKPTALDTFQVVTGRLACVALAGTILAEAITGKGVLGLLNIDTGVEITEIEGGLTFLLLLLFTADSPSHEEDKDPK